MSADPIDIEAAAAGLLALAEHGIPPDIQELLVRGDPMRGIRPGALIASIKATIKAYRDEKPGYTQYTEFRP
jgi:hypothetical protein